MDDAQQDQYEERLKEVFDSFDASGLGSLCPEELSELCLSLHLEEATPALLHTLLQNQDRLTCRVDFDQFKNALILVLSTTIAAPSPSQDTSAPPDSPEVHPKFVRGSKRYGRRSTPEFIPDFSEAISIEATEDPEENDDSTVPRKRERWNAQETNTEEYEAEGQLHLWNPDEPTTPRGSIVPLSDRLEERLRCACEELAVPWDGCASYHELLALCEHLGLEVTEDELQCLGGDGVTSVQEFLTRVLNHSKPPTPSASTPYRQLKRHHSTQPFDETGRRIATASVMTGTIGMRLFSTLDDGTGYIPVEYILDAWLEEGIENSPEILQALDFSLDGKVNLTELTLALENELLITKNGIHQAALASFKAEIRHLLECVDRELREKEKIRSDLEKAEKIKTQLATEVDEHHSAIERMNDLNLRKLEQDHKEKLAAVKSELIKEMDLMQLQAGLQREELEAEMEKIRDDETFLRDHLSITVKENRRLEIELFDSTEKLGEAESQVSKLQKNLDNVLKEKFGDMDPGCAEFFLQEERLRQLRSSYEEQCRALQDRIDELQAELQEFQSLGRAPQLGLKPFLSEEFESKSPGMESDPGIGSEEGQPFNMSLEAEMMLEQLKEQHLREMESLRAQLESKVSEFDEKVEEQRTAHDELKAALSLQYLKEIQSLRQEMSSVQNQAQELQSQLEQAELERANVEQRQAGEREDLESQQEEEISNLRQELLETHTHVADIEEQLKALETQRAEAELGVDTKMEELRRLHAEELNRLDGEHEELLQVRLEDERGKLQWERAEIERKLLEGWESEKVQLQQRHEEALKARIEEMSVRFQAEREEHEMRLTEEWEKERAQLDEQGNESLQVVLEEEMLRLVKQQEERESRLIEQWEVERAQLQDYQESALFAKIADESERLQQQHELREKKLKEEWEKERLQLEEDYEGMLQDRLREEREKLQEEKELLEKRLGQLMEEEKTRLEERHREAMHELSAKHTEEREKLSGLLDKLREDIAEERKELENHFSQKIKEVEARFSGDQDAVSKRFETDVSNLEQHYQSQLKALSDSHAEQKIKWEAEIEKAHQEAEEQRTILKKAMALEQEHLNQELVKEQDQLESIHKEKIDDLMAKNQELQVELDGFIRIAQTKEIELSRQLNDLHNRFQENLDTKDELLAQSEKKVLEIELLLNQAVEDFKQERAELQGSLDELEAKHTEVLSMAEKKFEERGKLLSECDDLRLKIQELEILLSQAVDDFELERQELQENTLELEVRLKEKLSSSELQESERAENEKVGLMAGRHQLCIRIQEMGVELNQLVESTDTAEDKEMKELNEINSPLEEEDLKAKTLMTSSPEEQEPFSEHIKVSGEICDNETIAIPEDWGFLDVQSENNIITEACDQEVTVSDGLNVIVVEYATSAEQGQDDEVEMITESPDGMEGCLDNTITIHEVVGDEAIVDDSHVPVVEIEGQDDNASEGGTESPEDIEVCHANIIISVELCDDDVCTIPEEEEFQIAEDQEEAEDNFDEYSNDNVIEYHFPEYEPQTDDVDEDKEMSCDSSVLEHSSPEVEELDGDSDVDEFGLDNVMYELFALEDNPQDVDADEDEGSSPHKDVQSNVTVIDPSSPEERNYTDRLQKKTQDLESEIELIPQLQQACDEVDVCEIINLGQVQGQASCLAELQDQYDTATEENMLLQQKITILESLLAVNNEKIAAGQQALEDNCKLKAKMLAIMEQTTEMEMKASELTDLQIRYEECICENAKLGEQNYKLEKRVMGFESKMHIIQDFQDQQVALVDEIARMREENCKLTALVSELERQDELLLALQQEAESTEATPEESFLDLSSQLEEKIQAVSDLEDCCTEFEKQNGMLRKALTDLQDNSLRIHERMQAHRNESGRLAGENLVLRHKISSLKEEELKETQEEMLLKLEYLRKEKIAAQKMAESFKKQVSELRRRSQQLEGENGLLSQKNAENAANVEGLSQQLNELLRQSEREEAVRDAGPVSADEKTGLAACVSALEAELTMALEASVLLEEEKSQLMQQLSAHREKVAKMGAIESQFTHLLQERQSADKLTQGLRTQLSTAQDRIQTLNETLQAVNLQSARLKSDLRVSQQEKDALKQDVISLHKQLQNANDKNQVLEMALHSSGFQSQHKKLYRDELARLVEQEQQMLRQENERLQLEVHNTKGDLIHTREKTRQLEATILSLKQQKQQVQSSLVKALEQDNASLKRELDTLHKERLSTKNMACEDGEGQRELESLRQENEGLKAHQTRLQTQLLEALQAQLGGLLPVSPHRLPGERRGQHRGDDPENVQDDREMQMMNMEGRMREIELSLHNVKLLLKEKVSQLKDQLHRNGKADVLIKDLYVENAQLLKALEMTEQRQKVAEKKNYLLEEKISSLNKIVRDLSPSPLPTVPYHFTCS